MRQKGFTLIELMVAVAILAIVAAIAVPLYTQYTQRTFRSEAQADLLNCAQGLERFNAINFTYIGAQISNADGTCGANVANGEACVCNPTSVQGGRYAIAVQPNINTFLLTATPQDGPVVGTGDILLDQAGTRTNWVDD